MRIKFRKESKEYFGILGGYPYFEDEYLWPLIPNTEKKMTLLATLLPSVLGYELDDNLCISIFISIERNNAGLIDNSSVQEYSIANKSELSKLKNGYTKVIIHKKSKEPLIKNDVEMLPKYYMEREEYTKEENNRQTDLMDDYVYGLDKSTIRRGFFFKNERVNPMPVAKYSGLFQIEERELIELSEEFRFIFNEGFGYLYMDRNHRRVPLNGEIGYFFVQ